MYHKNVKLSGQFQSTSEDHVIVGYDMQNFS